MTKPVAVLFDVDETLVHTGGAGARSWMAAFEKLYGVPADIGAHTSAGETDPEVAGETFRAVLGRDPTPDELGRLYAQYLLALAEDIWTSKEYRVLPGAEQLLVRLGEAGVLLGLVSGAMEGAARTKLMPANLNRFFVFGAYGSDSPDRAELTKLAIEKATRLHRRAHRGPGLRGGRHAPRHLGGPGGGRRLGRRGHRPLLDRRIGGDGRSCPRLPRGPVPGAVTTVTPRPARETGSR